MRWMKGRTRLATVALAVVAAVVAGGCGGDGAGGDKAGGAGEPVVLRMANSYGDLQSVPVIEYFVSQVKERSGGNVRIQVVDRWGDFSADAEQQVVRAVAADEIDLGWAGARVFDTVGVTSFQALQAPMLIDSYALQQAVVASDIPARMMEELNKLGVTGLGVLADGLRKPIALEQPLLGAADWRGITFGTSYKSGVQAQAIRALGATPMEVLGPTREQALKDGQLQGFELDLFLYERNLLANRAPYVAANVTLWPQMDVLLANPSRLERLTEQQRGWLQQAAQDATSRSAALADRDARSLKVACQSGARFANASQADLAALRKAFAPVYASLMQDPQTKAFIKRIRALKESTHAEPLLSIPAACSGQAPKQASGSTGTAPAYLNGTYRYTLTKEDARRAGEPDLSEYPRINTWILKYGRFDATGGFTGNYSVDGNRITFDPIDEDLTTTFTFTVDNEGNLNLDPVLPVDPGDAFEMGAHTVWTKIG
jgi:TRAP-type transport system periplasmic protein